MARKPVINLPGRKIAPGEEPSFSGRIQDNDIFLIGDITKVDIDRQKIFVTLRRNKAVGEIDLVFNQPYAGTSSFIQATPEEGSIILIAHQGDDMFPIAYLPNYTFGLENRNIKKWPDNIRTQDTNEYFYRIRKLEEGQIALGSKEGTEILLSDILKMEDGIGNNIVIRPYDNSIINTSNNNYSFSSGVWVSSGIIRRNSMDPSDAEDIPNIFKECLNNDNFSYVLRPGKSNKPSDPYLTEYLIEVEDRDFSNIPINDVNMFSDRNFRKPIIIFSLGNLVGNNPQYTGTYGKVLRPVLFTDPDDEIGDFSLEPVSGEDIDLLASAFSIYKPNRSNQEIGTYLGIDKEGHFYQYLSSATGGLGNGRSMSVLARGSRKEIWGRDSRYGNSWDYRATGGIKWVIGSHNERDNNPQSNRSIDIRTDRSSVFIFGAELDDNLYDFDNKNKELDNIRDYYKVEKIDGKERKEVNSTRETIIRGNDKLKIDGEKVERIIGSRTVNIGVNENLIIGEVFTERVTKAKSETFGKRNTVITQGSNSLKISSLKGDIIEEIDKVGNKIISIRTGNIEEQVTTGSRSFITNAGNYKVTTKSGNINMSTKNGQVALQTKVGKASFGASLNIDIKTKPMSTVKVQGGTINLKGKSGISGGVITSKTHLDYVTGAPLKGSTSVKATV